MRKADQKTALKKARIFIRNGVVNKAAGISRKRLIQLEMPRLAIVSTRKTGFADFQHLCLGLCHQQR